MTQHSNNAVRINDFFNSMTNDNYATTATSAPAGYAAAVFADGHAFTSAQPGTTALQVFLGGTDYLTVASAAGLQYAAANNYTFVATVGYVYTAQQVPGTTVDQDRWNKAIELLSMI